MKFEIFNFYNEIEDILEFVLFLRKNTRYITVNIT